jgi:type IV pilus assembly protein PilA
VKGEFEGKDLPTAKANLKITVHATDPKQGTIQVSTNLRLVNQMLYMQLASLEGSMKDELNSLTGQVKSGQWYSLSLKELQEKSEEQTGVSQEETAAIMKEMADAMLSVSSKQNGSDTVYTLQLKRNAASAWNKLLPQLTKKYPSLAAGTGRSSMSNRELAEMRKALAKLRLTLTATFGPADAPKSLASSLSYNSREGTFSLQGSHTLRTSPVQVTAPANAVSIDEMIKNEQQKQEGQFSDARNAQRRSDVNSILNAVYQYAIDHNGNFPAGIPSTSSPICKMRTSCAGVNLDVLGEAYLVDIPSDPSQPKGSTDSGYRIVKDMNGRITISAPQAELGATISVTR